MPRLRILHVSDLHERVELDWMSDDRKQKIRNSAASRVRVLEESNFHEIIKDLRKTGDIDLVCFTGDVADWGLDDEYRDATARIDAILSAAGVDRARLFVIPGNHDIQRTAHAKVWESLRGLAMRQPDDYSLWMAGGPTPHGVTPEWRDLITEREGAFWSWVEHTLDRPELLPRRNSHGRLGYCAQVTTHLPFPVRVIGLDSAWLCGDDHDARKLRITDHQIDRLARDVRGKKLDGFRLCLVHHPLSDLADERWALARLSETVDLVLHGHQHEPIAEVRADPDRSLRVLAAGSLYEGDVGDSWINGFQAIDAHLDDKGSPLRYEIRFWSWSKAGHWHASGAIYRNAKDGVLSIDIKSARPVPVAPPIDLDWYFVPRTALLEELKTGLLGKPKIVALVGLPGAGKSSFAADIAGDEFVQRAFPHGVFWVQIGQEGALLLSKLQRLLNDLGYAGAAADDIEECSRRLAEALRSRTALIVVDDAWRNEDVRPFLNPGASKVLLTTRDREITDFAKAWTRRVEPFDETEALALFERRLERELVGDDRENAKRVAKLVGYLPLSLAAACARFEEEESWGPLLADLEDKVKRVNALRPPGDDKPGAPLSPAAAFELSVGQLSPQDADAFSLLSLLAEDVSFSSDVAANLWGPTPEDPEARLRRFRRKELLLRAAPQGGKSRYQLHDEQRNAGARRLKLSPVEAHARLLDAYRRTSAKLSGVQDDGYIHDHVVWHLVQGKRLDELHAMLREEREGKNAWFAGRSFVGYVDDLQLAASASTSDAGRAARYAMMRSTLATMGKNVAWGLLEQLVKRGTWSEDRVWAYVSALPPARRATALKILMKHFEGRFRDRCFTAHLSDIEAASDEHKANLFYSTPYVLSHAQMDRLLDAAKRVKRERAPAVVAALRHFAAADRLDDLFRELDALERTDLGERYGTPWTMSWLIRWLGLQNQLTATGINRLFVRFNNDGKIRAESAWRLAQLGEIDQALQIADESAQADPFVAIAPSLRSDQLDRAAKAAEKIAHEPSRARALAAIYDHQSEPRRAELFEKLWSQSSGDAKSLTTEFLPAEIVRDLRLPESDNGRTVLIRRLVSLNLTDRALSLLKPVSRMKSTELAIVAERLPEPEIVRLGVNDPDVDPWILVALLPRWAALGHGSESVALLNRLVGEPYAFEQAVGDVAPHLDNDQLVGALRVCDAIRDDVLRERCLIELAATAPEALGADLLSLPIERVFGHEKIHKLARGLPAALATEFRASMRSRINRLAVTTSHDEAVGGALLEDLNAAVDESAERRAAARDLLAADWVPRYQSVRSSLAYFVRALEICSSSERPAVLEIGRRALEGIGIDHVEASLAFYSTAGVIAAVERDFLEHRAINLSGMGDIAAATEGADRERIEGMLLVSLEARGSYDAVQQVVSCEALTPRLLDFAFNSSKDIEGTLGLIGLALVEHLAEAGRIADAIEIANRLGDPLGLVRAPIAIALHAPAPLSMKYLEEAWSLLFRDEFTNRNWNDAEYIESLMPLVLEQRREVLEDLYRRAVRALSRQPRQDMFEYLAPLSPMLRALGGTPAVVEAFRAAQDVGRWWP